MADQSQTCGASGSRWLADLFRRQHPVLLRGLRSLVRDPDDLADIVQDAFARMAAAPQQSPPRAPEAYLRRVVRNLAIDRSRRPERRAGPFLSIDDVDLPGVAPEQEHCLAANDLMRAYRAAIAKLTPRTREVFLMHRVDDLSYAQIAAKLGISVATVEYHIGRALAHLDELLER